MMLRMTVNFCFGGLGKSCWVGYALVKRENRPSLCQAGDSRSQSHGEPSFAYAHVF
jgi:hypothetical protein